MSPRTLTRRPLGLALAPAPEKRKPAMTMTWAELARAEGHRPGVPATPNGGPPTPLPTRILRALLRHGPMLASDLSNRFHVPRADFAPAMESLLAEGLAEAVPAPTPARPRRELVALTEAGERRARE